MDTVVLFLPVVMVLRLVEPNVKMAHVFNIMIKTIGMELKKDFVHGVIMLSHAHVMQHITRKRICVCVPKDMS